MGSQIVTVIAKEIVSFLLKATAVSKMGAFEIVAVWTNVRPLLGKFVSKDVRMWLERLKIIYYLCLKKDNLDPLKTLIKKKI